MQGEDEFQLETVALNAKNVSLHIKKSIQKVSRQYCPKIIIMKVF